MSLRKAFRSRKFSRSFRELISRDEDQARDGDRRIVRGSAELDRIAGCADSSSSSWSTMLPELLGEIIQRVENSEDKWPRRKNVVACACVCKRWRDITKEIVRSPSYSGKITFPSCLKQRVDYPSNMDAERTAQILEKLSKDVAVIRTTLQELTTLLREHSIALGSRQNGDRETGREGKNFCQLDANKKVMMPRSVDMINEFLAEWRGREKEKFQEKTTLEK